MISRLAAMAALTLLAGCALQPETFPEMGDGLNVPKFEASVRCPELVPNGPVSDLQEVCEYVEETRRERLKAPPGARVYRERWSMGCIGAPCSGTLVLTIYPDGRRTLKTPWRRGNYTLKPNELPDFEQRIAGSHFAELPYFVELPIVCIGGALTSLEAIVDGKYRLVFFGACTGVIDEEIALALDQLFLLGVGLSGLSHPYSPERPTFRGYGRPSE